MSRSRALLQSTLFAALFLQLVQTTESCVTNDTKCGNQTVPYVNFAESTGSWANAERRCGAAYRLVVANFDEMCKLKYGMRYHNSASSWVDFAWNISRPLFSMNTTFLGVNLNLTQNYSPGECLVLQYDQNRDTFMWILSECNAGGHAIFCVDERRQYWNSSGTNNVFAGSPDNSIESIEKRIQDCARGSICKSDCDRYNISGFYISKFITLDGSNCGDQTVEFDHYIAVCPSTPEDFKFVVTEITSSFSELHDFIPKNFRDTERAGTDKTDILHPLKSKLISISVISDEGAIAPVTNITFKYRLDYKRLFKENSYNLSYRSVGGGVLRTTYRYLRHKPIGVFLDPTTKRFDTLGVACSGNDELVSCTSNHTTIFAVLLSVETVEIPADLKICGVVTQSISVFFLLLTFVILLKVRKNVRGERIPIQINLAFSLLHLNFWLLWGDIAIHYPAFCRAIAVLTYFFLLSSALWMMNEAHLLFFRTSKWAALATRRRKIVIATMCTGWGVPAIITVITTTVGFSRNSFMEVSDFMQSDELESGVDITHGPLYEHCLISAENEMRLAAIIPVAVILAYNFVVAIRAVVFVHRKRSESGKYMPSDQDHGNDKIKSHQKHLGDILHSLKVIIFLLPILGLPWILTLLSNWGPETVKLGFMYTSTIINGLQGMFIFLIYCVVDTKVREVLRRNLGHLSTSISDSLDRKRIYSPNNSGFGLTSAVSTNNSSGKNDAETVGTNL